MKQCLTLLILMLVFAACTTELPLPDASGEHTIVLLGELTADDTMLLRAGQSISLTSGGTEPGLIQHLAVVVKDSSSGLSTALEEREDYLSYSLFTVPFTSSAIIKAGGRYQVSAKHPELGEAGASVAIPMPFTANRRGTAFANYNNDSVLLLDIDISDPDAGNAQYVIEAVKQPVSITGYFFYDTFIYAIDENRRLYDSLKSAGENVSEYYDTSYSGLYIRQQFYTTDELIDHASGAGQGRLSRRVFLQGKSFNGSTHHTQVLIPRKDIYGVFGQFAQTTIYIKSVAADYYTFLKAYEVYDPSAGVGGDANQARLPGNVIGGFGMIGGVFRQRFDMLY